MDYLDFEVTVRGGATGNVVEARSPAGEASAPFILERPDPFPSLLAEAGTRSLDAAEAQEVGTGLFDALFPGPIRERYRESLGMVRERGARLVISFRCDPIEISALPWELLYDPVEARFLAASLETSFARYVPLPARQRAISVRPPLRLLLVAASPAGLPPLDVDGELARIRQVLRPLQAGDQLEVRLLQHATADSLREALDWGPHLLHVISHGRRGADGVGELVLEDKYGDPLVMEAGDLASLLNETEVRCLVLMACHTASGSATGTLSGLGPALVRAGVAAVVTLQQELPDKAALEFSTSFYRAIADGQSVGVAVNIARRDMRAAGGQQRGEWAVPVLHTRYPGGQVFVSPGGTVKVEDGQAEEVHDRRRRRLGASRREETRPPTEDVLPEPEEEHPTEDDRRHDADGAGRRPLPVRPLASIGGALALVVVALLAWHAGVFGAGGGPTPMPTPTATEAAVVPTVARPTAAPTATAAPTPTPTSTTTTVLLADSLGGPTSSAVPSPSASTGDYRFGFNLGEYFISRTNAADTKDVVAALPNLGANTAVSIDARVDSPQPGDFVEVGCRLQSAATSASPSGYAFRVDPSQGQIAVVRLDGGQAVMLFPWQQSMNLFPNTADNQLELDCVGNSIQAWVNGTQVARATDSTYTGGRTFLGVGVDANFNRGGGLVEG
ncbi:MAG TPA: CHAT domain-containing protein, partial [Thermomicrobiaceae bacterium]|nr:CHAT domain-containing protein [Thermomicrobiaceae bacterium]